MGPPKATTAVAARCGISSMSKQRRSAGRGAMRGGDRRSSADASEAVLWREEEGGSGIVAANGEEDGWKCWRHPSQPRYGVCPACLRDRLLLLCPDCARIRPCICGSFASSSSSSFSSLSSAEPIRSGFRRGDGAEIGVVGPVLRLIEREPAFRRSRSVGFQLLRSKPTTPAGADVEPPPSRWRGPKIWPPFWRRNQPMEDTKQPNLYRSTSVAAGHLPDVGAGAETEGTRKLLRWHFPSPIKALRSRKAPAKAVLR